MKRRSKRVLAVLLMVTIILAGIQFPMKQVEAAELTLPIVSGVITADGSGNGKLEVNATNDFNSISKLAAEKIGGLEVKLKVNEYNASSGTGTPGVLGFICYGSNYDWLSDGSWQNLSVNQEITVALNFTSILSKTGTVHNYGIQFCNISGNISYEIISAKFITTDEVIDHTTDDSTTGSQIDTTTNLELEVEYNYAKLLQESLYFYDANMCGPEVAPSTVFPWISQRH